MQEERRVVRRAADQRQYASTRGIEGDHRPFPTSERGVGMPLEIGIQSEFELSTGRGPIHAEGPDRPASRVYLQPLDAGRTHEVGIVHLLQADLPHVCGRTLDAPMFQSVQVGARGRPDISQHVRERASIGIKAHRQRLDAHPTKAVLLLDDLGCHVNARAHVHRSWEIGPPSALLDLVAELLGGNAERAGQQGNHLRVFGDLRRLGRDEDRLPITRQQNPLTINDPTARSEAIHLHEPGAVRPLAQFVGLNDL